MASPFDTRAEDLPDRLAVFPLPGVLLLPRARLPLNIFEPRYLAMTEDALANGRLIGMIQPDDPEDDLAAPALSAIGCAGRITAFQETDDGRMLMTLEGVSRFRITHELETPGGRGYRTVEPDWAAFSGDLAPETGESFSRDNVLKELKGFLGDRGEGLDWEALGKMPGESLINTLSMVCPFSPREKQALLESPTVGDRAEMMTAIMEYAAHAGIEDGEGSHVRH